MHKFFGLFLCLFTFSAFAQEYQNLLDEVLIEGNNIRAYDQDWGIESIDTIPIMTLTGSGLTELLEQNSIGGLRVRAGASTISFRGLLSSHTQMLWNGIPLQSTSLGLVDLSTFPSSVYRNASVSKGGSSALYGSGALGGTIHLEDRIGESDCGAFSGGYRYGSFGMNAVDLAYKNGNQDHGVEVSGYGTIDQNEFSYVNTSQLEKPTETMEDAGYSFAGLKLSAYQRIGRGRIFINLWGHAHEQELQRPMTSRLNDQEGPGQQDTRYLRGMVGYRNESNPIWFDLRMGYVVDKIDFEDVGISTSTTTSNFVVKAEAGKNLSEKVGLMVGIQNQLRDAEIREYYEDPREIISSIYFSLNYVPTERWRLNFSGRQTLWRGDVVPFSPEIQSDLILLKQERSQLHFLAKGSYNYRLPTLNHQYWDPGGNPDVNPERSLYAESGFLFENQGEHRYSIGIVGFYTKVFDLLVWLPQDSVWSGSAGDYIPGPAWGVINQDELISKGIELRGNYRKSINDHIGLGMGFAWSPLSSRGEEPTAYIPYQTGLFDFSLAYKKLIIRYSLKFTGQRPTIGAVDYLDPYTLQYLEANYGFRTPKFQSNLFLRVDNLADVSYQSFQWYAMPGRRFSIGLNFLIK